MKQITKEKAKQVLEKLEHFFTDYYDYECSADGVYLSDGIYVSPLEYAVMQGDLTEKQEKQFNTALSVLYPEDSEE